MISVLTTSYTKKLCILPEMFAVVGPANIIGIRMLAPLGLPITPNGSFRLRSVLFRDEDVRAFVREDVFPPAPYTAAFIIWPYELPFVVLSP